jgi:site-specific DNA-methyltransferase (adenine-specific)
MTARPRSFIAPADRSHDVLPLFISDEPIAESTGVGADAIDYHPTPSWFGAAIVDRYLGDLDADDVVCEPFAGDGAILRAIPPGIRAFGIEIDATLAQRARSSSGRTVLVGDALTIALPEIPTRIVSNIPFRVDVLSRLLDRMYPVIAERSSLTLLCPVFCLQTSSRVSRYAQRYSIGVDLIPRDIFPGLPLPLAIAVFTKEATRRLVGMAFVHEVAEQKKFPAEFRAILDRAQTNVWVAACLRALDLLGGRGSVQQVTNVISGFRPTQTEHWREAVRKALSQHFPNEERGVYHLPTAA